MGRRNKKTQENLQSRSSCTCCNGDTQGSNPDDAFAKCIGDRLKPLGLCASDDEYSSISEAIAGSAPVDAPPSEDDLENVTDSLLDYFEEVSEDDAKALIYAAAYEAWGDDVARITASVDNVDEKNNDSNTQIGADESEDNSGEFVDDDDGDFIGEGECELCERSIKLTRHHLIPKTTWTRMKKRFWNAAPVIESLHSLSSRIDEANNGQRQRDLQEKQKVLQEKLEKLLGGTAGLSNLPVAITHDNVRAYLSQVSLLCRQCHSTIHRIHTEWELATEYNTIERLLECEEIIKFGRWANKQRPGKYAV